MDVYKEDQPQGKLLKTLEGLLELPVTDIAVTLQQTAQLVADVLAADKVDIFFHDSHNDTLIALGTSDTPMGRKQHAIGMERLPLVNGGRTAEVFLSGVSYLSGQVDQDPLELDGIKFGLGARSEMVATFHVEQQHRGVISAVSSHPDYFSQDDLHFLEAVARWMGIVIERVELVEQMQREAREQGRRLAAEELLTVMAHDLRNYLTPLQGRLELIARRARRESREPDIRDADASLHTLHLLERVIGNLLDVARLNQGLFVIAPVPMNLIDLIQEVVKAFQSEASPIDVHAPEEVVLVADPNRLRQLLENLLANAVKYAPSNTSITVKVSHERHADGPWVSLMVSNQGPGISLEKLASLFQPFVAGTESSGLGLGLYLANRIAQAHGGTLSANSSAGQGVHLTLSLPIEDE